MESKVSRFYFPISYIFRQSNFVSIAKPAMQPSLRLSVIGQIPISKHYSSKYQGLSQRNLSTKELSLVVWLAVWLVWDLSSPGFGTTTRGISRNTQHQIRRFLKLSNGINLNSRDLSAPAFHPEARKAQKVSTKSAIRPEYLTRLKRRARRSHPNCLNAN